jgi:hypothetical protein
MWGQAGQYVADNFNIRYMQPHPTISGIYVRTIEAKSFNRSLTDVVVTASYRTPQFFGTSDTIIRFSSTTKDVQYSVDNKGKPIQVTYTPSSGGGQIQQIVQLTEPYAYMILEFEFSSYVPPTIPFLQAANTLNSAPWQGGAINTWWFRETTGEYNIFRGEYRIVYRFEYDPLTHLAVGAYRDPDGYIPTDTANVDYTKPSGNGWVRTTRRGTYDFNQLNLPNVF